MAEGLEPSGSNSQPTSSVSSVYLSRDRKDSSDDEFDSYPEYGTHSGDEGLDFSYQDLDNGMLVENMSFGEADPSSQSKIQYLYLQHNRLDYYPSYVSTFYNLRHLDISNNHLSDISEEITSLQHLVVLVARSNFLGDYSLPKKLGLLRKLKELNLSGNLLRTLPPEILDIKNLRVLRLGGNSIEELPRDIWKLEKLEILYLGGNNLKDLPATMGQLHCLKSLVLCDNQLQSLPSTISCLRKLKSLALHKNQLTTLPPEIVTLGQLVELSLRDNPLVVRFVQEMTYDPPSLQELAARCIKICRVPYTEKDVPRNLMVYLQSACRCVNPKCKGVYFDVRVEHIKFVDFCGKYRIPLLQYLCSPRCSVQPSYNASDTNSSDDDGDVPRSRINRVLLG